MYLERRWSDCPMRQQKKGIPAYRGNSSVEPASVETVEPASVETSTDPRYSHYIQYYLHLVREQSESQNELDKSIINISSASIAASIAIIKPLYDTVGISFLWLVFISWIAFCCAIMCTIESYQRSVNDYREPIANCHSLMFGEVKKEAQGESDPEGKGKGKSGSNKLRVSMTTASFNVIARLSFYTGVTLFLVFVGLNVARSKSPTSMVNSSSASASSLQSTINNASSSHRTSPQQHLIKKQSLPRVNKKGTP
ncbi:MAG: hypothetical protein JWQ02_4080 [Capsulimonas sp.]|nr:hypothetical protein [Capsulimonas sp.]